MPRSLALAAGLLLCAAAPAVASPLIHAHRGGPLVEGDRAYGENTLAAFENAARQGFVVELDVKLSAPADANADPVPIVIHDATFDRTTNCQGPVNAKRPQEIAADCEVDVLGTAGNIEVLEAGDPRREPVPTLEQALDALAAHRAQVNLEIKNLPTEPDFDNTDRFADLVVDVIERSPMPRDDIIVQSFWPPNLDVVEQRLGDGRPVTTVPEVETSLLTSNSLALGNVTVPFQTNEGGPAFAAARGYEWVSPQWPLASGQVLVSEAHAIGRQVVPWTLNTEDRIVAAFNLGVDAVISDDPTRARRVIGGLDGEPPAMPPPPTAAECEATRASRLSPPIEAYDPAPGAPRMFAMQPKQELRHVVTYQSFRTKIECMIREYVLPRLARGRPDIVAFNEDIGLMTLGTGTRGLPAREIFGDPDFPSCEEQGAPCATLGALAAVTGAYSPQVAAYRARFPESQPVSSAFVAATDTLARGWMQTFADMAKRYGIYILGSNNQAAFRESRDPAEIALFRDPDLPPPRSVYVATEPEVYNEVFMWGPEDVRQEGPRPMRNVVARNKKVPITSIERQLQLSDGPSTGPDAIANLRPYQVPGTEARISFATSLPAFIYGPNSHTNFGQPLAPGIDPCENTALYYMRCMDRLGANVVMQDEANPGRWAGDAGEGTWQPLEWMRSTWRAAADPSVPFSYNVTPFMVGNLADLAFDGQTAITQRGLAGERSCTYVGNTFMPGPPENDPARLQVYAGPKQEFIAITPWVAPDGTRDSLRETARRLSPSSNDELENDYLESAIIADLPFPPDPDRANCVTPRRRPGRGRGSRPPRLTERVGSAKEQRLPE